MTEIYSLMLDGGNLVFNPSQEKIPQCALDDKFSEEVLKTGLGVFCRMGDPDLVHCVVYRWQKKPGGIFIAHDGGGLLFAALAENNLVFAVACGYFGELTANTRYGADIFEEMHEPDD